MITDLNLGPSTLKKGNSRHAKNKNPPRGKNGEAAIFGSQGNKKKNIPTYRTLSKRRDYRLKD